MNEKRLRGRPVIRTADERREQSKIRKQKFDRKQRLIKILTNEVVKAKSNNLQVWMDFLVWAKGDGDDQHVGVRWEDGGGTRNFSELAKELLGENRQPKGPICAIEYIR